MANNMIDAVERERERKAAYLQITRRCNNRCLFCSNPQFDDEPSLSEIISQISAFKKSGVTELIITGGEPTLSPFLLEAISYSFKCGLDVRVITNGVMLSDYEFVARLRKSGLLKLSISLHHCLPLFGDMLSQKAGHLHKSIQGLANSLSLGFDVVINMTLNSVTAKSLSKVVGYYISNFPAVKHYVFNGLDPGDADGRIKSRVSQNRALVPRLVDIELELSRTLALLTESDKSFRVERVPLCYMAGYGEFSTEARKIIKSEEYICSFLRQDKSYDLRTVAPGIRKTKAVCCAVCTFNNICAGVQDEYAKIHGLSELYPRFSDPFVIAQRIIGSAGVRTNATAMDASFDSEYPPKAEYRKINQKFAYDSWANAEQNVPAYIYLHMPFCKSKCTFCSCDSKAISSNSCKNELRDYLAALIEEAKILSKACRNLAFSGIYFGGGTPTVLDLAQLRLVYETIKSGFRFVPTRNIGNIPEFSIEATPDTLDKAKIATLAALGVNRVSIGVQSLDYATLKAINRQQSFGLIKSHVAEFRQNKIAKINIDMVAGLPWESVDSFCEGMKAVISLSPASFQVCTFKPRSSTIFFKSGGRLKPEDYLRMERMRAIAHSMLKRAGYSAYRYNDEVYYRAGKLAESVSRYELDRLESNANVTGIGAGAESHIFSRLAYINEGINGYKQAIEKGALPLAGGVQMDKPREMKRYLLSHNMGELPGRGELGEYKFKRLFGNPPSSYPSLNISARECLVIDMKEYIKGHPRLFNKPTALAKKLGMIQDIARSGYEERCEYPPDLSFGSACFSDAVAEWKTCLGKNKGSKLGLYVNIPFCNGKCLFCNCYSVSAGRGEISAYLSSMGKEIEAYSGMFKNNKFDTAYIGGGCPTLLGCGQLLRLFRLLRKKFAIGWINIESPPWLVTKSIAMLLYKNNVMRVSIGVQSFSQNVLRAMNRCQDNESVKKAVENLRRAGISSVNLDIIAGLPGETIESFKSGVVKALELKPEGLHFYLFLPSHNTAFVKEGGKLSHEELKKSHEMISAVRKLVSDSGYREVAKNIYLRNDCPLDATNLHSLNEFEERSSVLGLGAGAMSHIYSRMFYKNALLNEYTRGRFISLGIGVSEQDEKARYIINHLARGISRRKFGILFSSSLLGRKAGFNDELRLLAQFRKTRDSKDRIVSCMPGSEERLFERLFYSERVLAAELKARALR